MMTNKTLASGKALTAFAALCFCLVAGLFTSCSKDETEQSPPEPKEAEYTIMLYGCGGGNLDALMETALSEALTTGTNDRVKMTGQVKYSKTYQARPEVAGVNRFVVPVKGVTPVKERVGDASYPLYNPQHLADFIKWSKEQCPAKNYILLLWNHGGGWFPVMDDPKTRAVLFDDNVDDLALSLDELVQGVKLSGTHLKMVYYNACLMNMLENLCGLEEIADYAGASSHVMADSSSNLSDLINELTDHADFEEAMTEFCENSKPIWDTYEYRLDFMVTRLDKLPAVTSVLKDISEELIDLYDETAPDGTPYRTLIDQASDGCYRFDGIYPYVDVMDYVTKLAAYSGDPDLLRLHGELRHAKNAAVVSSVRTASTGSQEISWSVTLIADVPWREVYASSSYSQLAFNQASRWSDWLTVNKQMPAHGPIGNETHEEDITEELEKFLAYYIIDPPPFQ